MATVTQTYADNSYYDSSMKKTWTVSYTYNNFTASESTFTFGTPTITAKFVGSVGLYRRTEVSAYITIGSTYTGGYLWLDPYTYADTEFGGTAVSGASNATFTMTKRNSMPPSYPFPSNYVSHSRTLNTSDYFNSNNKTTKTVNISANFSLNLGTVANSSGTGDFSRYMGGPTITIGTLTLNAPPTFTASALSGDTNGYWAGATTVSTTISSASAKYGGNITSSSLTIGDQTVSGSGNGTLSIALANAGTFTPQVSVTDSRGQVTTKSLDAITVNPYLVPSVSFDVYRTNASGVKDDEGHCGLIIGQMTYTDALANLTEPSVSIDGTPIEDVVGATVTWYTGYSASTGVDATTEIDGTNITWADVASGSTVYALIDCDYDITGKFSEGLSYQIGIVANDSIDGHSTPIIQTLSTAFYTIDFQAGGKEIAFGAPANDDVTNYEEGLFKCAMSFRLKDHLIWIGTRSEYDDAVDDGKMPEHSIVIITDEYADYVVEQGTSGNWTYRKWDSGTLEQWYESGDTTYAITTARGNLYTGNWLSSTYPIEFVGYPRSSASVSLGTTAYAVFAQVDNRFTDTAWIRGVCGSSIASSSGYHFSIYAIGRWK